MTDRVGLGLAVESTLRAGRDAGRKLLVTYATGGLGPDWTDALRAMVDNGADLVEVGFPFSDPVMDGPTIQEASVQALAAGANPVSILDAVQRIEVPVPLVAMTYYNLVFRAGHSRFARMLVESGVRGALGARPAPRRVRRVGAGRRGRGRRDGAAGRPRDTGRAPGGAVRAVAWIHLWRQPDGRHW